MKEEKELIDQKAVLRDVATMYKNQKKKKEGNFPHLLTLQDIADKYGITKQGVLYFIKKNERKTNKNK